MSTDISDIIDSIQEEDEDIVLSTLSVEGSTKKAFIKPPFKGREFFVSDGERKVMIPFHKIFHRIPEYAFAERYEIFNMAISSKRTFNKIKDEICDDNNRILNHTFTRLMIDGDGNTIKKYINKKMNVSEEFILKCLSLKMNISDSGDLAQLPYKIFICELMNIISDEMIDMVTHYIDSVYVGSMDEIIDMDKHEFGLSTTFVDKDIKIFCKVKYIGNLLIPLGVEYCAINGRTIDAKDFFFELYTSIFARVEPDGYLLEKLHRYITMMVTTAVKNNKKIYDKMAIKAVTIDSEIENVLSKILTTIIPKIAPIDTVPAYISTAIKMTASKFKPHEPFGFHIYSFSDDAVMGGGNDDNVVTEAERMDSKLVKPNKGLEIIRKNFCDDTINKISYRYNIFIDNMSEYNYTINNMDMNNFQTNIIFQTFHNFYGGYENMYDNNRHNYTRLLILCDKYLRSLGLDIMADYVSAKDIGYSCQQRWGGKVSDRRLFDDPKYNKLINEKYKFIKAHIERKNFIREDMVTIANTKFVYNRPNDSRNGTYITHSDEEIIDCVLDYYLKAVI